MQVTSRADSDVAAGPLWWGAAAVLGAFCVVASVVSRTGAHEAVYAPGVLGMAAAFAYVVRRRRLEPLTGWTVFAVGLCLLAVGDCVYALPVDSDIGGSGLTVADPFYLIGSLVIVAGALRIKGAHVGEARRDALIDAASIGLAAGVLLWHPLIEPRLNMADTPLGARLVNGSYPVLDVVVLAMMLWLLLGGRRWTPATVLLVAGSTFYLVADLAYTIRIEQGTMDDVSLNWLDTLWLVAYGLYLLAALHPSARLLARQVPDEDRPISRGRLALSGVTLLAPMIALALGGTDLPHLLLALAVEAILVALVLLRLSDLAAGEHRARQAVLDRERYFRSLVQNSSEAMLVIDRSGVVRDASPAVRTLLGVSPDAMVDSRATEAVAGVDRSVTDAMWARAVASPHEVVTDEIPLETNGRTRWLEMRVTNLLDDPAVGGLVVNVTDVTARRQVQADLERRAFTDGLTGLPNRALFHDRLDQMLDRRDPPDLAVVYCDLDGFKAVNDRFGHAEGDRLLEIVGSRLATVVRSEDTVARLGGDEFAVLVHGDDAVRVAEDIADRIVVELRRPFLVGAEVVPVSVSVGVASSMRSAPAGARVLMHTADEAMYRAKRSGGDRVVVIGPGPELVGRGDVDASAARPA